MLSGREKIIFGDELCVLRVNALRDQEFGASFARLRQQYLYRLALLPDRQDNGREREYHNKTKQTKIDLMRATQPVRRFITRRLQIERRRVARRTVIDTNGGATETNTAQRVHQHGNLRFGGHRQRYNDLFLLWITPYNLNIVVGLIRRKWCVPIKLKSDDFRQILFGRQRQRNCLHQCLICG